MSTTLRKLLLILAQALADAMACPALTKLRPGTTVPLVLKYAKLAQLPAAQTVENPKLALGRLALALAAVQEHEDIPVELYDDLADFAEDVMSLLHEGVPSEQYDAARLRFHVATYAPEATPSANDLVAENARLKLLLEQARSREQATLEAFRDLEQMAAETAQYAPEIEARRADYERLAECFIIMTELEHARLPSLLDLDGPGEDDGDHFGNAFFEHLHVLACKLLDWFDARTLRKFYPEMRLWADQLNYEREQARRKQSAA